MQIFDIAECESVIGYSFKDKMLLRRCFTHASYAYENGGEDNELLEFFGDAIIEFVVTEHLYKNACGDEGVLTKKRANVVSKEPLLKAMDKLGLDRFILLRIKCFFEDALRTHHTHTKTVGKTTNF